MENRCLMSAGGTAIAPMTPAHVGAVAAADLEAQDDATATVTTIAVPSATLLGQNFTVTVTVKDSMGDPVQGGTVDLLDGGTATGLSATVGAGGIASFNFGAGNALYAGSYTLGAQYLGTSIAAASTSANASLVVSLPSFTTQGDGLEVATVTPGSGPGAVSGQNMTVEYTGFYQSSGAEFDESAAHAPGTFSYTLNADPEQVITGFDEGTTGIELGETRVVVIPSDLGYQDGMVRIFVIQSVEPGLQISGPAAQLNFGGQPSSAAIGQPAGTPFTVDVEDDSNNIVTSDSSAVTVAIASGPIGATLGGTTTIAVQNGEATFSDLTFSEAGTYTLVASDGALTTATSGPIAVSGTATSAVAPTLGKVSLPAAVVAGGKIAAKVPVVVTNQGSALKGKITVNIYADTANSLDGNQVLVTTSTKALSLKANATHDFSFEIKSLPATLSDGTYYLLAEVVDPSGATSVTATSQTVTVAAPFVQPVISVASVTPSSIASGKSGSVEVTITNAGNVSAAGMELMLNLSSDGIAPVPGAILQTIKSSATIAPNKSKTFKLHFKVLSTLAAGSYYPYLALTLGGVSVADVGSAQFTIG